MTFYFVYLLYTIVALLVAVPSHASLLMSKQIELSSESSLTALLSNVPYNVRLTDEASSEITCRSADAIRYPRQWELKRTALVSYPRSGNSWTRNLLQKASGYLTTSIYHDKSLYKSMPGEQFKHDNFLVKTHFPLFAENVGQTLDDLLMPSSQQAYYDQAIYLVRNPFDSILSYYQYQRGNNSHTQKVELSPEYLTVEILEPFIQWYKIFFEYWEKVRLPFLILRYEDMRKEPAEALEKIIDFLVPLPQYAHSPLGYLTWNARKKAKIQCAIRDDQAKRDIPYVTNRYRKLHSLRYYAPDTITYLLKVLQEPICAFDYAQDINTALNRTAICCPPK